MKNICTVFGLGNFTKMPGTLGSIAGVFLGFILLSFFPIQLVIVFFIFLLAHFTLCYQNLPETSRKVR